MLDNLQFKRDSLPMDDEDLATVAKAVIPLIRGGVHRLPDMPLMIAKLVLRVSAKPPAPETPPPRPAGPRSTVALVPRLHRGQDYLGPEPTEPCTYTDAELYRLIVAKALLESRAQSKSEFDEQVFQYNSFVGGIKRADIIINARRLRPGCMAYKLGKTMVCDCGASWPADSDDRPDCKVLP